MDPLEEQLAQLSLLNSRVLPTTQRSNYASVDATNVYHNESAAAAAAKKIAPMVPPKPNKIQQIRESLYASCKDMKPATSTVAGVDSSSIYHKPNKETLDNPAVLEQKLEALAYHKQQLEKKKGQQPHPFDNIPKLSSSSLVQKELRPKQYASSNIYSNFEVGQANGSSSAAINLYGNLLQQKQAKQAAALAQRNDTNNYKLYCNVPFDSGSSLQPKPAKSQATHPIIASATAMPLTQHMLSLQSSASSAAADDDFPREHDELPPPSPVSSSYSELRRATHIFQNNNQAPIANKLNANSATPSPSLHYVEKPLTPRSTQTNPYGEVYVDNSTTNEFSNYSLNLEGGSSTYESIYEPINPRPSSQMSARFNYLNYSPYENAAAIAENNAAAVGNGSGGVLSSNSSNFGSLPRGQSSNYPPESNDSTHNSKMDTLNSYMDAPSTIGEQEELDDDDDAGETEHYGICYKCNQRVLDETSGCTAMDQIYHIACFTCFQCQINLQGKPFYGIEGKPYCEYDYLQTLEKCSVCMKPILERILRATGKPYHPQCFTCVVCGNSLDGIPFTVDATNQNYCIEDFHKKFAPRCCVCKEPIMPEPGEEETVRVVALDRSFHFQCYKCEDCGLLLSSEAEGRGCYPLDDHVLCKSCNARRVQLLTNRMTTEL